MPSQELIENLQALLQSHSEIQLAILFGSAATDAQRPDSDIDLAVQGSHPLAADEKMLLIEEVANLCGRPVDLIDLRTAGEPLLGEILKGRRIIGSTEDHARLMTRHLLDVADFVPLQQRILKERRDRWIKE